MDYNLTTSAYTGLNSSEDFASSDENSTEMEMNSTEVSPLKRYDFLNPMWNVSFTISVIVGTLGNLIVLWIVLCHKRMWTSTNYFLVNLSITDLLLTVLNGLFNFIYMRDGNWIFGDVYCTINNFVSYVTVAASVLTLTAITIDRYRAIIYPLRPKLSRWVILGTIIAIWITSSLLALPSLLYSSTFSNTKITVCIMYWPDGIAHHSKTDYIYNIVFFLATYVVPLILMALCYSRMGFHLWGTPIVGEETETLRKNYQNKKKVVKMFVIVVSVFSVCWLPYHVYFLYTYHNKEVARHAATKHVYLGIYWLAMSNTTVNPIIYYWMNVRFRKYFVRFLLFIPRLICGKSCWRDIDTGHNFHSATINHSNRNSYRDPRRSSSQRSMMSKRLSKSSQPTSLLADTLPSTRNTDENTSNLLDTTTDSSTFPTASRTNNYSAKMSGTLTVPSNMNLWTKNGSNGCSRSIRWGEKSDGSNWMEMKQFDVSS